MRAFYHFLFKTGITCRCFPMNERVIMIEFLLGGRSPTFLKRPSLFDEGENRQMFFIFTAIIRYFISNYYLQ